MSLRDEIRRRNVLRIALAYVAIAWLTIQFAATVVPWFGLSASVSRLVAILAAIGIVPALVLAWVFEFTPQGLKLEKDLDGDRPGTPFSAKRFDRIVMLLWAIALFYFGLEKIVPGPVREAAPIEESIQPARKSDHTPLGQSRPGDGGSAAGRRTKIPGSLPYYCSGSSKRSRSSLDAQKHLVGSPTF